MWLTRETRNHASSVTRPENVSGEGSGVGCCLSRALFPHPRTDVEHERRHAEQSREKDDGEHSRLAALRAKLVHSTRSVVLLVRKPSAATQPSRLIEYG